MRFLWLLKCCIRAMGHSRSAHGHHLISGLTQGLCVCLYFNESHIFSDFLHWCSIFNTCNFPWSCNYTITYKIISVTHRCIGFFIINISHITLAVFFSFLTWLGFEMTKIRICWQQPLLSPSFPLSLFLSHSVTLPFLVPCDSQLAHLWWVWWPPPPFSRISFLPSLFSFTLLSFLLCSIFLFYPPSYHFYSALLLSLP